MGRSQLKYRTSHGGGGRGRGGNGNAERGAANGPRTTGPSAARTKGGKSLESNAFRFQEFDKAHNMERGSNDQEQAENDQEELEDNEVDASETSARVLLSRDAYFQTKSVKEWEGQDLTATSQSALSGLDINWIADQLLAVEPSVRYQLDPKYVQGFEFRPTSPVEEDEDSVDSTDDGDLIHLNDLDLLPPESSVRTTATAWATLSAIATPKGTKPQADRNTPSTSAAKPACDHDLDELLQLSAQAQAPPDTLFGSSSSTIPHQLAPNTKEEDDDEEEQVALEQEEKQLEDWLDDVLEL